MSFTHKAYQLSPANKVQLAMILFVSRQTPLAARLFCEAVMKKYSVAIIALTALFSLNTAFAVELVNDATGKTKIGVVSVSGAYSLDNLTHKLAVKAEKEGASSMKIIAAGGENKMQGVAEIYK